MKKTIMLMLALPLISLPNLSLSKQAHLRNPFAPPKKKRKSKKVKKAKPKKKKKKSPQLKLIGTIKSNNTIGAIVKHKKEQKIIFADDKISGYKVLSISPQNVLLKKGEKTKTLTMSKKRKNK